MKRIVLACLIVLSYCSSIAQSAATSADIYLGIKKLNVLGSVLYIAAHPDDENTRLLTYLSKDRLYRTGYLSLTRGDGGQNLIGNEQGIALGLIRTQELLAARRIDGAEQFFTRAYDFGFSKNPQETFTKWDKEKILADIVWTIRKFQPDVIITRFPTTGEGGHGHHTASAILANEAFTAAADPKRFPEQLKYVQPWQAKRILWNTFNFGSTNTQREDQFKFDVGGFNAVLGKSYGEIAAESRSQHKSQGFGVPASRGEALEYLSTTGGAAPAKDLMDDVETSWKKVQGGEQAAQLIQKVVTSFDFVQPQKSLPGLLAVYKALQDLQPGYWRTQKMKEVQKLVAQASGVWMEATTALQNAVQGDSLKVNFNLNNRSGSALQINKITVDGFDTTLNQMLPANKNLSFTKTIFVSPEKPISQPYWLKEKMQEGMFVINEQQLIGQPDITPSFITRFDLSVENIPFTFEEAVRYKHTDPVKGELYQPLFVMPSATISSTPDVVVIKKEENETREVAVQVMANRRLQSPVATINLQSPNFNLSKKDSSFSLEKGAVRNYYFPIAANTKAAGMETVKTSALYKTAGKEDKASLTMTEIHYDHIPDIRYFYSDDVKVLNLDLKTVGKKIGYIVGAGDKVPEALEQMGYDVVLLTDKELARNSLSQFNAIIAGVRAYNTNEWLNGYYEKLMHYVEDGGNLIVQYNTSTQIGPVRAKIGPYSFNITRNRITDENASVNFLKPAHAALNFPNKITTDDFKGWVQERSIYHAADTDKNFETVLSMNDPGEQADNGSLVIAKYGKGYFTYTGLVFFRELPAGVPGAYRLLANLIALNYKKTF